MDPNISLSTSGGRAGGAVAVGIAVFATDESVGIADLARMVEARGFESLWLPEHTHIPAARTSPYPGGGPLPREYTRMLDPFVALAVAATVTTRLRVAFGICLLNQRDPLITAKAVATLDLLSDGRVIFGVGAGWNVEEMLHHGVDPGKRIGMLLEQVAALRLLWSEDEASYAGRYVHFERVLSWPKPLQHPGPPVLIGGNGRTVEDRVIRYGDGWIPGLRDDDAEMLHRIAALRERAEAAGRAIEITMNNMAADGARVARYVDSGLVDRMIFYVPSAERDVVDKHLDLVQAALQDAGIGPAGGGSPATAKGEKG